MGRGIERHDTPGSTVVAVVNETFVKKFFSPGENPIGRHFGSGDVNDFEIVGVVDDTVYQDVRWKDHLMFFQPMMQRLARDKNPIEHDESLYLGAVVLKTTHPVPEMENIARRALSEINPNLAVVKFQTFDAANFRPVHSRPDVGAIDGAVRQPGAASGVGRALRGKRILSGAAHCRNRHTHGARRGARECHGHDHAQCGSAGWPGTWLGIPIAWLCVRFVESQLYEIKGIDAPVLLSAVLVLALAATLAGLIPARRAASIDPAKALRNE